MITILIRALRGLLFLSACLASVPAAWAVTAGTMEFVLGDVRIRGAAGVERKAAKGTAVEVGESVVTGAGGSAQLRMVDNAFLAVRPDTELAISDYRYSGKADGTENALLRLVKGTMRAFTGAIALARKDRFSTVTPTATIGIRGSGNVAHYSPNLGTLNHTIEGSHVVSSLDQQGQVIGSVITTPGQTVQVLANQVPVRIPTPPFLLQAATSRPAPGGAPGPGGQKAPGQTGQAEKGETQAQPQGAEGGTSTVTTARATAAPDTALVSAATTLTAPAPVTTAITTTTTTALATTLTGTVCDPNTSNCTSTINTTTGTVGTVPPPSDTTAPVTPVPTVVFHNPSFASPPNGYASLALATKAASGGFEGVVVEPHGGVVSQPATNYLLDPGNNLAQIQESYPIEANGFNYIDTTTDTTSSATGRYIKFSGGSAQDTFAASDGSIYLGRWQGGSLDLYSDTGPTGGNTLLESIALGSRSAHWALGVVTPPSYVQQLTGTTNYSVLASTHPTDALGNVGTLGSAKLTADFSAQTVRAGVSLSFASTGVNIDAFTPSVPIDPSGGFSSETASQFPISINGCVGVSCPYHGGIHGGFARPDASAALMGYEFMPNLGAVPANTPNSDVIQGVVAFQTPTPPMLRTILGTNVLASYYYFDQPLLSFGQNDRPASVDFEAIESVALFTGPNGNLISAAELSQPALHARLLSLSGDTSGASTVTTLTNGISFGRYSGVDQNQKGPVLTVDGVDDQGPFTGRTVIGSFNWIQGPPVLPVFATEPITGSASYSVLGNSDPTDQNNVTGTLNSATLNVSFDRQAVDTSLDISMPADSIMTGGRHWTAKASNIALGDNGSFRADTFVGADLTHRNLTVALNGDSTNNPQGHVSGTLTGPQLNGAILSYTLGWGTSGSHEHVNGVVGFGTPSFSSAPSVSSPYQIRLGARGSVDGFDAATGSNIAGSAGASSIEPDEYLTRTTISAQDPARLKFDSQGAVTEFDGRSVLVSGVSGGICSSTSPCFPDEIPTRIGINTSGSAASGALPAMPPIASGAATVAEFGSDPFTGISWGRYSNGNFAVVDRITGTAIGSGNASLGPINHYLLGPVQAGPTTLPTTGTATYTLVGATSPTEFANGAVTLGTLNSATLSANFTAKTIDTGINLTTGARTWTAAATGVPILAGLGFEAGRSLSGSGPLTVGCAGTGCNAASLAGRITGAFFGSTGQGAGIAYSLNTGGAPSAGGITVGGVAAFRR